MIFLNIFALFCIILVNGKTIPVEKGSTNLPPVISESSPTVFENDKPQYSCTSPYMNVSGLDIRMSDVVDTFCWAISMDIQIFAQNKIFIDCDIKKYGAKLSVFAPTWEIIGKQKIILSGTDGESHKHPTASDAGTNGEPGLPGDAGGVFIGFGEHLINANKLTIKANGGNGGPGQNGAKGIDGINGKEITVESVQTNDDLQKILKESNLNYTTEIKRHRDSYVSVFEVIYKINGDEANSSGDGGDGGAGGLGGPVGSIYLNGFDNFPNLERNEGENGMVGKGGLPGNPARNGRDAKCYFTVTNPNWIASFPSEIVHCKLLSDFTIGPTGKNGSDGGNEVDRRQPQTAMSIDSDAINSFEQFVKMNSVNTDKESDFTKFFGKL